MSFLLFKAPLLFLRTEVVKITHDPDRDKEGSHDPGSGEEGSHKEGSWISNSDLALGPLPMVNGDISSDQGDPEASTLGPNELEEDSVEVERLDFLKSEYFEQQQAWKELHILRGGGNEPGHLEQLHHLDESPEDALVSHTHLLAETSTEHSCEIPAVKESGTSVCRLDKHITEQIVTSALSLAVESKSSITNEGANLSTDCRDGSPKLKSALRGGFEKLGLGPRPKLRVTWAPDVYDPPPTSTSHTSNRSRRRRHYPKNDHKNHQKGKASSHEKKSQKKNMRKLRHANEPFMLSGPTILPPKGKLNGSWILREYVAPFDDFTLKSAKPSPVTHMNFFLNPVVSLGERELVTVPGCPRRVQTHKLYA